MGKRARALVTRRRDAGIFLLGHASRPSLARSVADFLSAHVPRRKIPTSRLSTVVAILICGFNNRRAKPFSNCEYRSTSPWALVPHCCALVTVNTYAAAWSGAGVVFLRLYKTGMFWKSLQGCTRGVSEKDHTRPGPSHPTINRSQTRSYSLSAGI